MVLLTRSERDVLPGYAQHPRRFDQRLFMLRISLARRAYGCLMKSGPPSHHQLSGIRPDASPGSKSLRSRVHWCKRSLSAIHQCCGSALRSSGQQSLRATDTGTYSTRKQSHAALRLRRFLGNTCGKPQAHLPCSKWHRTGCRVPAMNGIPFH